MTADHPSPDGANTCGGCHLGCASIWSRLALAGTTRMRVKFLVALKI